MNEMQSKVLEFHRVMGSTIGETIDLRDASLRANLIEEEANETLDAIRWGRLPEAIDGLCDLLYVVFGAAVAWGIDLEPYFNEVHRSNMTKTRDGKRGDGKIMKGPNYEPPQIKQMLEVAKDPLMQLAASANDPVGSPIIPEQAKRGPGRPRKNQEENQ